MQRAHTTRLTLVMLLLIGMIFAGTAAASGTVALRVLDGNGDPLPGAFVALLSPADPAAYATATTDSSGEVTFTSVVDGDYLVRIAAPGHNVAEVDLSGFTSADGHTSELELVSVGSPFKGLGAYGAQVSGVVADGLSGVFYASTTGIPSLYRTSDYGGTWTPVTLETDDSAVGIDAQSTVSNPTTSGYPGEIAGLVGNQLYYSRDFGISWDSVQLTGGGPGAQLLWGHVGDTSLLLITSSSARGFQWAAMPTGDSIAVPSFQTIALADSFKQNNDDAVHIWNGPSTPILGVATATGIALYELDGTNMTRTSAGSLTENPGTFFSGSEVPTLMRIGGGAGPDVGSQAGPSDVLLYSHSAGSNSGEAVYLRYDETEGGYVAAPGYTISGNFAGTCGANLTGTVASIAPGGGAGTIGQCWVSYELGNNATATRVANINNNTGFAFDAGYDGSSNSVILSGDGSKGVMKSAQALSGVPQFPGFPTMAGSGSASTTGGVAVNGINAAVIRDSVFAPGSADDVIITFSFSGGGRVVGSTDGGETFFDVMQNDGQKGANAVDWWQGATDELIMIGRPDGGNRIGLSALDSPFTTTTTIVMQADTGGTAFEDSSFTGGQNYPISIAGIDGADAAYVGTGVNSSREGSGGLYFVDMSSGVTISRIGSGTNAVAALDYCPTTGSASSLQDVLFAAEAGIGSGRLMRYTGAADGVPSGVSGITQAMNDVRAACADGVVYGAAASSGTGSGLWKSTDGGQTFTQRTISGTGISTQLQANLRNIETLAVDTADGNRVVIVSREGDMLLSEDGGTTWLVLNDTTGSGRKFGAELPGDIEFPVALSIGSSPVPSSAAAAQPIRPQPRLTSGGVTSGGALFGSASGAFNVEQIIYELYLPYGTRTR